MSEAEASLASALRSESLDQMKGQHQILALAATVAAATVSFGGARLKGEPDLLALLSLLYVGFWLAMLGQEQDIVLTGRFLVLDNNLGEHSSVQAKWEAFRYRQLEGTRFSWFLSTATSVGLYAIPIVGAIGFAIAALNVDHGKSTVIIVIASALLGVMALAMSRSTINAYTELGKEAAAASPSGV